MKHTEFANAMLDLERAINKAHKIAEVEFMDSLRIYGSNDLTKEWYNAMHATEAMTYIKCMINVEWEKREGE